MIPGFPCQCTTTPDGYPIIIVDYPERFPIETPEPDPVLWKRLNDMLSDLRRSRKMEIVCNDKPF